APVATLASPVRPDPPRHDPGDELVTRHLLMPLLRSTLREVYADLALMEDAVGDSALRGGLLVSRADVAHLMLATLDRPETIGQPIGIAGGRRYRSTP
ncbi:MAG: NAD(P)-dependent oxidoreductase, partial [Actinomycetes bacterium]